MKKDANAIEWGAFVYEWKRIGRRGLFKFPARDKSWRYPTATGLVFSLGLLGTMIFLGIFVYRDVPFLVFFPVLGAAALAGKIWEERNPLMMEPVGEFITSTCFSDRTWYKASLSLGLLLSLGLGVVIAAGTLVWFALIEENQPIDDGDVWGIAALPMVTGLFFLFHIGCQRRKFLCQLGVESLEGTEHLIGEVERAPVRGIWRVLFSPASFFALYVIVLNWHVGFQWAVAGFAIGFLIVLAVFVIRVIRCPNAADPTKLFYCGAIVLYGLICMHLRVRGVEVPLYELPDLADHVPIPVSVAVVSLLFALAAWRNGIWRPAKKAVVPPGRRTSRESK